MSDLETGRRLDQDPILWLYIESRLEQALTDELTKLNPRLDPMQEVRSLAKNMKEQIAALKKQYASSGLQAEITRANINAQKIASLTQDLSEANGEVEDFLGEAGTNFPPTETATPHADINGVTVNKGQ